MNLLAFYQECRSLPKCFITERSTVKASLFYDKGYNNFRTQSLNFQAKPYFFPVAFLQASSVLYAYRHVRT